MQILTGHMNFKSCYNFSKSNWKQSITFIFLDLEFLYPPIPGIQNGHRSQRLLFSRLKLITLVTLKYYFLSQFQVVMMLQWSAMVSAMMRPTMQTATMMVGSAVDQTFPVSSLAFLLKNLNPNYSSILDNSKDSVCLPSLQRNSFDY